jgi:hypothetical protein
MRVKNENLLIIDSAAAPSDMSVAIEMRPIWLGHIANYAVQLVFTGSPAGNFKLQASNDEGQPAATADSQKYAGVVNWTDIAGSQQAISAAGDLMYQVQNIGYNWVKVVWTPTSGNGTITTARAYVKGV